MNVGPFPEPAQPPESFSTYRQLVLDVAARHAYPADLLAAQCGAESGWHAKAKSRVGALGLMQFMPATWAEWGDRQDATDPEASLDAGARYMLWLGGQVRTWESPVEAALAAYNWGLGNLRKARAAAIVAGAGLLHLPPAEVPRVHSTAWLALEQHVPKETRDYVSRILGSRARYAAVLAEVRA